MDYNGEFRDLPHLCQINQAGIDKFKLPEDSKEKDKPEDSKEEGNE